MHATGQKQGRNEFVIRLQPSEAMYMKLTVSIWWTNQHNLANYWKERFTLTYDSLGYAFATQVKQPGLEMQTVQSELDLSYGQRYQGVSIPEAYERLILDT